MAESSPMKASGKARHQILKAEIIDLEKDIKALEKSKTRKLAILEKKKREQIDAEMEDVAPQIAQAVIEQMDADAEAKNKRKKKKS